MGGPTGCQSWVRVHVPRWRLKTCLRRVIADEEGEKTELQSWAFEAMVNVQKHILGFDMEGYVAGESMLYRTKLFGTWSMRRRPWKSLLVHMAIVAADQSTRLEIRHHHIVVLLSKALRKQAVESSSAPSRCT